MTGGWDDDMRLSSTEIYQDFSWRLVGELPEASSRVHGANINNIIFMIGKSFTLIWW